MGIMLSLAAAPRPETTRAAMKEGKEVTKSGRKKLVKDWERQKALHEKWKKAQGMVEEGAKTMELPVREKKDES